MYELIVSEKPKAAQKIAEALATGKVEKKSEKGVPYYKIKRNGKDIIVGCAVGHLYSIAEKGKKKWEYPIFDVEWKPTYSTDKNSAFAKKYFDVLKKLSKDATSFMVACDYDIEGEVIGLNIVRYIAKQKDARRMKFSTLTKKELQDAYDKASPTITWGLAEAGETRHKLDYYYGINISRALTSAVKSTGKFLILSSGRVQGPALKIIVDKEKEIKAFIPEPYWQIKVLGEVKEGVIEFLHEADKFFEKEKADKVMSKVKKNDTGVIESVDKKEFEQAPPNPFDLTTLQTESYRVHRISPKETLSIAQDLYTSGLISYPRTSSQQLPPSIEYKKILKDLSKQSEYKELCKTLSAKADLKPNNGSKTDPAHPAIYPTGQHSALKDRKAKVYDLIVRRFLATFGDPALRETMTITLNVKDEKFLAKGTRTVKEGWYVYYGSYVGSKETELPKAVKGEKANVNEINLIEDQTKPPRRYTPSSIIRELEKRELGTKATRAQIVDTLYTRGYANGTPIEATDLGIKIIDILGKYIPEIIDEELTRHFEREMDEVQDRSKKEDDVLTEAEDILRKVLKEFKSKEKKVGGGLADARLESLIKENTIGKCPVCAEGTLMIKRGKFGRFIACDKYPDCKITFKLPSGGMVKNSDKICEHCSHPMIMIIKKAKRPQEVCINLECPSKTSEISSDAKKKMAQVENGEVQHECPKCKEGKLVLRKSVYGRFYGCSRFPKCRYIAKVE